MDRKDDAVASGSGIDAEECPPPPIRGKGSEAGSSTGEQNEGYGGSSP